MRWREESVSPLSLSGLPWPGCGLRMRSGTQEGATDPGSGEKTGLDWNSGALGSRLTQLSHYLFF